MVTKSEKRLVGSRYNFKIGYTDEKGKGRRTWLKAKDETAAYAKFVAARIRAGKQVFGIHIHPRMTEKEKKKDQFREYAWKHGLHAAQVRFGKRLTVSRYGNPLKKKRKR